VVDVANPGKRRRPIHPEAFIKERHLFFPSETLYIYKHC
jgi:hypothetical protein